MQQPETKSEERILRLADVKARTGLARSTIYLSINNGLFPRPINLGIRSVGWLESEVSAWINACIAKSRTCEAKLPP